MALLVTWAHNAYAIISSMKTWAKQRGFTIVELLIVIVVIAILAAISIVAYNGIQNRAKNTAVQNDIRQVAKLIELYNADKGSYPSTGGMNNVFTDSNCAFAPDADAAAGYRGSQWVPGLVGDYTSSLPQNPGLSGTGRAGLGGCYVYVSDGANYIVSAWNAKRNGPGTDAMYRRLGFRETSFFSANGYICNHTGTIGGLSGSPTVYSADTDFYKHSYTISNITTCNETPPSGA